MTHLIAGYPDLETSYQTAKALAENGAGILEIQFPFSDPSADGPTIQAACNLALESGFKVAQGFDLVTRLHAEFPTVPIFLMSYASLVFTPGVENFCQRSVAAGVRGLIIPDLSPGDDEGLYALGASMGLSIVPVIVPTITPRRLQQILELKPQHLYTAIRTGITGVDSEITPELLGFLDKLKTTGAQIMAGFGIVNSEQVRFIAPHVDYPVVGSALVRTVTRLAPQGPQAVYQAIGQQLRELNRGS